MFHEDARPNSFRLNSRIVAVAGVSALVGVVAVPVLTNVISNWDLLVFGGVSLSLILTNLLATIRVPNRNYEILMWRTGLIMWAFLLASQQFFLRPFTSADDALNYGYAPAAYAEAATWLVAALIIFVVAVRCRGQLVYMWSSNLKFVILFAIMCCLSASYSPSRVLAFAWVFKLVLVVLALGMCSTGMSDAAGIRSFLLSTFWGFVLLTLLPVINGVVTGQEAFSPDGRLSYFDHPVHGSQWAGLALLLALIVFEEDARLAIACTTISAGIMLASGGKAGIVAALLSALLWFAVKRKPGHALLMLVGMSAIGAAVLTYTPVSQYLEVYSESGGVGTLTGRTDLWTASVPMILEKPLLGHGYMSSRFMSQSDKLEAFNWGPTQTHNSFLEIAYMGGAVGLILLLTLHYLAIRNLWIAVTRNHPFAAGALALYLDVLLQSWVENSVAGKPSDSFMLLLGLVIVSEKLVKLEPIEVQSRLPI
jgi:O-antigen ligase